jgi:pilus assembly protein CpaF
MTQAVALITEQVRERVRREGIDVGSEGELVDRFVRDEVRAYSERALGGSLPPLVDEASATRQIVATLTGFGSLQRFLDDESVEEIWVNAPDRVFVARNGVPELTAVKLGATEVRDLVERMLQSSGRRVDLSSPFVDASLPDGSRLHVVIPDVTQRHWAVNIRKFASRIRDLDTLVELGSLSSAAAAFLRVSVLAGCNILVSGATQSGKTTMLNALLSAVPAEQRIVTVEETFELDLAAPDHVAMQCRQPSLEGVGEISLRRLIKEALRMRPDRIVVGEVREAESLDLLIALNSGLPGMSSIHANSARDALVKLSTLPLLAGRNIDSSFVVPTVAGSIDLVVHCELTREGRRRVVEVVAPTGRVSAEGIESTTLFELHRARLEATGAHPARVGKYRSVGADLGTLLVEAAP